MGIPLQPTEPTNECPLRFDVDETPSQVWASFTGLEDGPLRSFYDGPVPQGPYLLQNAGGCLWTHVGSDIEVNYTVNATRSLLSIDFTGPLIGWYSVAEPPKALNFEGSVGGFPPAVFNLGHGLVSFTSPASGPSLIEVAAMVNIGPDPKTFAEVWPDGAEQNSYRFARRSDHTSINILLDLP